MGAPKIKSKDDVQRLEAEMKKWMQVREKTARRKVSEAEEGLKRVLGENAKVKKALGIEPAVALIPPPQDEPRIVNETSQGHQHWERQKSKSPYHQSAHNEVLPSLDVSFEQQSYGGQDTKQIASLQKELEELRLQSEVLRNENWRFKSAHQTDQEIIEGLRLEMQQAITELDALRTRHITEPVHSAPDPTTASQHEEACMPRAPSITPQDPPVSHNCQATKTLVRSPSDIRPPKTAELHKIKRKKKKAAVMPTPIEPVLYMDPTNPQETSIQSYQQRMYQLQVKIYSRLPVDINDIPWPVFPIPGKTYPVTILGRKQIKSADVLEFAKGFWVGGKGPAKERAVKMISAWSWMCPPGRVECTKDLRSWIGRTTTFLRHAREKLSL